MSRPNLIARAITMLAAGAIVLVVVLVAGGGKSYDLKLRMANASGLRSGSQVLLGGVEVGSVNSVDMRGNTVLADLSLDPSQVRLGRGARASIIAANLLGEKYVALTPGDTSSPLPSGAILPQSATTLPSDLDQIVDVLDGPTRARLGMLLNDAGIAVAGRRSDIAAIFRQIPLSVTAATKLLTTMVRDNHTLADLVSSSDHFVTRVNDQSGDLKQAIGASAGAMTTFAQKAETLKRAVVGLAQPLSEIHRWFALGTVVLRQLTPVANQLTASAPRLDALLREVKPFTAAAVPALNRAASVAPTLTNLARQATPTITQAVPTISSLQNIAHLAQPLSAWAGLSSLDLLNIFGDWSGAIQYRDAASHIFSANVFIDPAIVLGAANRGATPAQRRQNLLDILSPDILRTLGLTRAQQLASQALSAPLKALGGLVGGSHPAAPKPAASGAAPGAATSTTATPPPTLGSTLGSTVGGLLGGLLGGHKGGGGSGGGGGTNSGHGAPSGPATSKGAGAGNGSALGSSIKGLLGYLLGK